jgi:hypothetical protein
MATFFRNKLESEIGISEIEVIDVRTNSRVTVIGMSVTNLTGGTNVSPSRLSS